MLAHYLAVHAYIAQCNKQLRSPSLREIGRMFPSPRTGKPRLPSLVAHWLKRMTALGLLEHNGNSYRALRVPAKLRKRQTV